MPHDGWIYQGRQYHQWFGHGTKPEDVPPAKLGMLDDRIRSLTHAAFAAMPSADRRHAALRFSAKETDQLVTAMRAWVGGLRLAPQRFAELLFGRAPGDAVVTAMRTAAQDVAHAKTHADMRAATEALADGIQAVGLDSWRRFLADASQRATASGLVPTEQGAAAHQTSAQPAKASAIPAKSTATPRQAATPERAARIAKLVQPGIGAKQADVDVVRAHLLAHVPNAVLSLMERTGVKILVTQQSVAPEMGPRANERPRAWTNSNWDIVPGVFIPERRTVLIATQDDGTGGRRMPDGREEGSVDVTIHEAGHGIDFYVDRSGLMSSRQDFIDAYEKDSTKKRFTNPYFHQADPEGGRQETWAESFSMYHTDPTRMKLDYPNLYEYFRKFMSKEETR